MELKGKQTKTVKRPKPNAVVLHLKSTIKTYHVNVRTVKDQLDHELRRLAFYKRCLAAELATNEFKTAKHTNLCIKVAEKCVARWQSALLTVSAELQHYEKDLRTLRAAYGFMRGKSLNDTYFEGDLAYAEYKKHLIASREIACRYAHVFTG